MSVTPATTPSPTKQAVIVGFGPVGRMTAAMLAPHGWQIHVLDTRPHDSIDTANILDSREQYHQVDASRPTPAVAEAVTVSSLVVLALPEGAALEALEALGPLLRQDALLVETLSRKDRLRERLASAVPNHAVLSINPLFHPGLGPRGNRIAVVDRVSHPVVADFVACIEDAGVQVVSMTAREHDEELVAVQALTHSALLAFARSLPDIVVNAERCMQIAPPPTRLLLALAARMASGSPETYWDIQEATFGAPSARVTLARALARLDDELAHDSTEAFTRSFASNRTWFGDNLAPLADLAQTVLSQNSDMTTRSTRTQDEQTPIPTSPPSEESPDVHEDHQPGERLRTPVGLDDRHVRPSGRGGHH
ncbi:2-dehydropantoate 2-reductase N-terminal domain-containing protein [Micromonospora echinospora]